MKESVLIMIFLSFLYSRKAQIIPSQIDSDIDQLRLLIESKHVRPYWITSKEDFQKQVQSSKKIISEKENCDESCYVEIFKVVSSISDGHSSISGTSRYDVFGYLPFTAKWFDGNLYVLKTSKEYKKILGHRITKVNGIDIELVLSKLKTVVPHANESRFKKFSGSYLHLPGLLYGLGITQDPKQAEFTFSNGKISFEEVINDMTPEEEETTEFILYILL